MTILRRLGLLLPCHFSLGRNKKLQGLAASIVKLWEKFKIAKIAALRCIGYLVVGHRQNLVAFASEVLWEEPNVEPALNSIPRILLRGFTAQEFAATDIVFRFFCEWNEYSIESSMERSPDHPHLPTPRRVVISPMRGKENIPIPATNMVDDPPVAPTALASSNCSSPQAPANVKFPAHPLLGCNCKGVCIYSRKCACTKLNGFEFLYVSKDGGR
ncbi:hypothetical protein C5167_009328 [Papaver somniferum]|uniref:Uncharacterized protein n=1 Tax=Papaver somniferum TaxID=3469 RepID=A0A4Y7JY80_PAPSO|nr:hypothetical protein C5167_009328 [Papaver somniferum]